MKDCMVCLVNWAHVASTFGPAGPAGQNTLPLGGVGGLRVPLANRWTPGVCPTLGMDPGRFACSRLGRTGTTLKRQFLQQNATLGHLLQHQEVDDAAAPSEARRPCGQGVL
jgi:hypothetical protein